MFCQNCGKELPPGAKFCTSCGTPAAVPEGAPPEPAPEPAGTAAEPVSKPPAGPSAGPEAEPAAAGPIAEVRAEPIAPLESAPPVLIREPGAPEPVLTGKKHAGRTLVPLILLALIAIALAAGAVKLLPSLLGGGGEKYLYATEDGELMYLKKLSAKSEAVEVADGECSTVRFSKDGKFLYYFGDMDETDYSGNLYVLPASQLGKKSAKPEKISSGVSPSSLRLLENGKVLYIKNSGDGQLRLYDGGESYKLAGGVYDYQVNEEETYVYYLSNENDGTETIHRAELKKDGKDEELLDGVEVFFGELDDDVLVYGKFQGDDEFSGEGLWDVYAAVPGERGTKAASDVIQVLGTIDGGRKGFAYTACETEEHTLYDYVTDSMAGSDSAQQEPDRGSFQTVDPYWGWTTTDWDAYYEAYDAWSEVQDRNYLRDELKSTPMNATTYTLHLYQNGEDTVLARRLTSAYPTCNVEEGIYFYQKADEDEIQPVADLSELDGSYELYDRIYDSGAGWYQNVGGTEREFDLSEDGYVSWFEVLDGKEVAVELYEDGDEELRIYAAGGDGLTEKDTLSSEASTNISIQDGALYFFTGLDREQTSGELVRYQNGKTSTIATDACQAAVLDSGAVFKMEDMEYDERYYCYPGTLYAVKDGKDVRIADDVWPLYNTAFLDAKRVVYISDGDLYFWNGSDSEKLADDVTAFWASGEAECTRFYCTW